MNISPIDETLLRKYLLGMLPERESDEIDQKLFTNDDFAKNVELIEDEIVDDYLDGTLRGKDKAAAERHFFQAPEHRSKLWFARLLRSHLQNQKQLVIRPAPIPWFRRPALAWAMSLATVTLLVAVVGLGVYTANLSQVAEREKADRQMAQSTLAQERKRVARLEAQMLLLQGQDTTGQTASASRPAVLDLMELERGDPGIPELNQNLEIHIALVHGVRNSYQAALQTSGGKKLWSKTGLKPAGNQLVFNVPRSLLTPGQYSVAIQAEGDSHEAIYPFVIR